MLTIQFESNPPDSVYRVDTAAAYARAVNDAQQGLDDTVNVPTGCLVAIDQSLERWVRVEGVDIGAPLSLAAMYKQWSSVYNCAGRSIRPVLKVVP